jgi:hypothetical protein
MHITRKSLLDNSLRQGNFAVSLVASCDSVAHSADRYFSQIGRGGGGVRCTVLAARGLVLFRTKESVVGAGVERSRLLTLATSARKNMANFSTSSLILVLSMKGVRETVVIRRRGGGARNGVEVRDGLVRDWPGWW